jgi:plasmid stability protein
MVWSTCVTVLRMSKMIQVRNVPDDVHRTLKARAAAEGLSLSDYIKRDLEASAARRSFEEINARVRARRPSGVRTEDIVGIIRAARDG